MEDLFRGVGVYYCKVGVVHLVLLNGVCFLSMGVFVRIVSLCIRRVSAAGGQLPKLFSIPKSQRQMINTVILQGKAIQIYIYLQFLVMKKLYLFNIFKI